MVAVACGHINIRLEIVNSPDLSAALLRTYLRLLGLASGQQETPPLSTQALLRVCACSERSLRGHLAELGRRGLIEVCHQPGRKVVIRFGEREDVGAAEEGGVQAAVGLVEKRQNLAVSGAAGQETDVPLLEKRQKFTASAAGGPEGEIGLLENRQNFAASATAEPETDVPLLENRQNFAASATEDIVIVVKSNISILSQQQASRPGKNKKGRAGGRGASACELPTALQEKLVRIGFCGARPMQELKAAWLENPGRVEGWVEYTLSHGLNGGFLLQEVRSGTDPPRKSRGEGGRAELLVWQVPGSGDDGHHGEGGAEDPLADDLGRSMRLVVGDQSVSAWEVWEETRKQLRARMGSRMYEALLANSHCIGVEDGQEGGRHTLVVQVPDRFAAEQLQRRLTPLVESTLRGVVGIGQDLGVRFEARRH